MRRLPAALAVLAVLLAVPGSIASAAMNWVGPVDLLVWSGFAVLGVASAATGAVVTSRERTNAVGWLILALGLGVGVLMASEAYAQAGRPARWGPWPGVPLAAWLADVTSIPLFFGVTGFLLLLFPDGRLLSRRWRPLAWCFGVAVAAATVSSGLSPGKVAAGIDNPFAVHGPAATTVEAVAVGTDLLALPAMLLAASAVAVRLRRSRGVARQQLKWFSYVAVTAGLGLGTTVLTSGLVADLAFFVGLVGVAALPVTAGLAILRYRLYDIDVVIKRTLVYVPLSVALAATYFLLVLTLQTTLRPVAGDSDLAVAASTLAVAALFRPLRGRLQGVVDRRFYRQRYDAARTVEAFTAHLREELDLEALVRDLRGVVHQTVAPAHVSLWMRDAT